MQGIVRGGLNDGGGGVDFGALVWSHSQGTENATAVNQVLNVSGKGMLIGISNVSGGTVALKLIIDGVTVLKSPNNYGISFAPNNRLFFMLPFETNLYVQCSSPQINIAYVLE
ncbi:hypothetical protein [Desulfocucumis palustris]|uniref:hypothetical protein n=1 Tax=Desulfocucumis palustris TaxID=1898651 RepID=UPI000CEA3028|nr:hypothetical protein [Desulfocucumis palustris]